MKLIALLLAVLGTVRSDVYLHNPRGSNNRFNENSREVKNNKRMFDSQNNNRGGYLEGNLYYYAGSVLPIEWTNQHSCNDPNNNCEIVLQYMCGPLVTDGTTTSTIPESTNTGRFGMHEDYQSYLRCRSRRRNNGLFTADQKLKRADARSTRQNAKGTRRGFECPEERDYYPYWHPTQWKDIVVMTNDITRCNYYKTESENVKGRGECIFPDADLLRYGKKGNFRVPNNEAECNSYEYRVGRQKKKGTWTIHDSHNLPAPECIEALWSRDNHLGNGLGGQHNVYNWKVPSSISPDDHCAIRIRYNISTNDFDSWSVDSSNNDNNIDIAGDYGLDQDDNKGYVYEGNPEVEIFEGVEFKLAINTAQFGRTFQDRSFTFQVKDPTDDNLDGKTIHNVNVRGKRGNIVQTYPSVEYDFVPNTLKMKKGEYVHFQWTGSNDNPQNNAGQGNAGTDRSNVIVMGPEVYHESTNQYNGYKKIMGDWGRNIPDVLNKDLLGFSLDDKTYLALLKKGGGNDKDLNKASTDFDLGPREVTQDGVFHYFSTRNNAFTNRCQKARIMVK